MAHDPRTPAAVRYIIYGGIVFTVIPDDWVPDWIPGLGLIDDAAVIPGVIAASMLLIPKEVKEESEREDALDTEHKRKQGTHYEAPVQTAGAGA